LGLEKARFPVALFAFRNRFDSSQENEPFSATLLVEQNRRFPTAARENANTWS
jgi:hypothetical protein